MEHCGTVQYTGGVNTLWGLGTRALAPCTASSWSWQYIPQLCNSPSHKIRILLASARDHELQKLTHLLKQGCLSMGEHRKLRDDVRRAYSALATESLQLLENTAKRHVHNNSGSTTTNSTVSSSQLMTSSPTCFSSESCDRDKVAAVEGTYKQLVSMFSLFPWSDTVLFDPSLCPPAFQQRPTSAAQRTTSPPTLGACPVFGQSGLGVLRSFQQIQNIAMQRYV